MRTKAIVNYHIQSDQPQAYHIDANGEEGNLVSPDLVPTEINVHDLRGSDAMVNFWHDSLDFVQSPSEVNDFETSDTWERIYDQELGNLLMDKIGAKEVIVFDHTIRVDDPESGRKPARNVHSDYSQLSAHERLKEIVGEDKAKEWEAGHFGFVNIWRPVRDSIISAPLGFVLPKSVNIKDWLILRLVYPDRIGQIMGLVANQAHQWVFLSNMKPDEVAFFNIYDNQGLASIAHSALDLVDDNVKQVVRRSIESRTLVRY